MRIIGHLPKARGGSDRTSNLTLACRRCNEEKGAWSVQEFLASRPEVRDRVLASAQRPLDAAAVNAVRWALVTALKATGLPVELASGGRTKWNRSRLAVPKEHGLDAACVGHVDQLHRWDLPVLVIRCVGRDSYQRTRLTAHGFPRCYLMRQKSVCGFQTGNTVRAKVSALMRGRLAGFSTDRLLRCLKALDCDVEIVIKRKPPSRQNARVRVITKIA